MLLRSFIEKAHLQKNRLRSQMESSVSSTASITYEID